YRGSWRRCPEFRSSGRGLLGLLRPARHSEPNPGRPIATPVYGAHLAPIAGTGNPRGPLKMSLTGSLAVWGPAHRVIGPGLLGTYGGVTGPGIVRPAGVHRRQDCKHLGARGAH